MPNALLGFLSLLGLLLTTPTTATQTLIVTTITQSAPSTPTDSALPAYTSPALLRTQTLNSTNTYRAQHNATALTWNATLATTATSWSARCVFQHSHGPTGENLAVNYGTPALAVDAWGDERKDYDFGEQGFSEATGHFTQLVWKGTSSVGCGATFCEGLGGWFVVCEYWPAGNVATEYGQNVQGRLEGMGNGGGEGEKGGKGEKGEGGKVGRGWWAWGVMVGVLGVVGGGWGAWADAVEL